MAEYWTFKEDKESAIREFLNKSAEPEMTLEFDVKVKDFINAGTASSSIKLTLKKLGVDPQILRRLAIACYEAEINIVAHSNGGKLYAYIHNELIHLKCKDEGPGLKDIDQAMVPGWSTADDLVREMGFGAGLGLPNIKKNSDMMHIISSENSPTLLEIIILY